MNGKIEILIRFSWMKRSFVGSKIKLYAIELNPNVISSVD